jgi:hypothetical protein
MKGYGRHVGVEEHVACVSLVLLCAPEVFQLLEQAVLAGTSASPHLQLGPKLSLTKSTCPAAAAAAGGTVGAHMQELLRPAWDFLPLLEAVLAGLERFAGFASEAGLPLAGRARNLSQYLPASLTDGAALLQLLEVRGPAALVLPRRSYGLQCSVRRCCTANSVCVCTVNALQISSSQLWLQLPTHGALLLPQAWSCLNELAQGGKRSTSALATASAVTRVGAVLKQPLVVSWLEINLNQLTPSKVRQTVAAAVCARRCAAHAGKVSAAGTAVDCWLPVMLAAACHQQLIVVRDVHARLIRGTWLLVAHVAAVTGGA